MGYETRLHIGEVYTWTDDNSIRDIALIDLSCAGHSTHTGMLLAAARAAKDKTYAVPNSGGNYDHEDRYGEPLTAVDIDSLIDAMEADNNNEEYRRFTLALAVLRAVKNDPSWRNLVVVQYGY